MSMFMLQFYFVGPINLFVCGIHLMFDLQKLDE